MVQCVMLHKYAYEGLCRLFMMRKMLRRATWSPTVRPEQTGAARADESEAVGFTGINLERSET